MNLVREELQPKKTDDSVERVRSLVRSDRRLTLRIISSELNLNRFTIHQIITQDLDMRKVCAKMVPKKLTTAQKANRRDVCLDLLHRPQREPEFFSRIITGDESWILEYDPETKRQSREWHTANYPRPKKARMSKSKTKLMPICFFDSQGVVHKEFVPPGQTVNQIFIGKSLKDSGKGWQVCDQALHALGCCTTTTPHVTRQSPSMNFWQKKAFLWFHSPPIRRISVPVTSFYSPDSKTT